MRRWLLAAGVATALAGEANAGKFVGELVLVPAGCEKQLECTLKHDFGFVDSKGIGWQAGAGLKTDGASIPPWAQPYVGGQFEKEFIRAAVIHDHYCRRHVRPWEQTHEVFYEALLTGGVAKAKALVMYYAVYLGGPKWVELIKGQPCPVGKACVKRIGPPLPPRARQERGEDGRDYAVRGAEYDRPEFARQLREAAKLIADRKGEVTLDDLRKRAKAAKPDDFFYSGADALMVDR